MKIVLAAEYVGHVTGGWEYVYTAYGITAVGVVLYALSLFIRRQEK